MVSLVPSKGRRRANALASPLDSEEGGDILTMGRSNLSNIIQNPIGFNHGDQTGLRGMWIINQDASLFVKEY